MNVLYSEHATMKNNPLGFVLTIALIPLGFVYMPYSLALILVSVGILLIWKLKNQATKLEVTDEEIHLEEGLLNKKYAEIRLNDVRAIKVDQSFLDRLMGTGTIEVYSAGDTPEIVAKGMPDPHKVREIT